MKRGAAIIFRSIILLLLGVGLGLILGDNKAHNFGFNGNDKIARALQLVDENYVDSVNIDSIEGVTVNNLLQGLDPHSLYLPPQQATSINERLDGGFDGIGIEFQLLRDTMVITQVSAGGPAAMAGITNGDKVLAVNNKPFTGKNLTLDSVNHVFRGQKGVALALEVKKPLGQIIKHYDIKRGHVDLSSLDAAYMAASGVGYIKISKFATTTDTDFKEALHKLKREGMKKLVIDLRGNGGGYLNAATALANEFLTKGKLIVYTKGVHEARTDYFATDSGQFEQGKLAVLIDEYSASASEIFAGAMQDLDRATIVGRRSFGKGLVQQQFGFGDGSAMNLTVARYYTPSGRSIQKSYKGGLESYHNELAERMRKGELFSAQRNMSDSIFRRQPSKYHTASGRKVFSGGGIMPDVFVPADTTLNTALVQELSERQLFGAYVIDKMQPTLQQYQTAADFIKGYNMDDDELNDFIVYASGTLKEMDSAEIRRSKPSIKLLIKAFAARFKWGDNAYFEVLNSNDATLKKALEIV
jgi:carboxyl-terminal processing protease